MKKYKLLAISLFILNCHDKEKNLHKKGIDVISQVFSDSINNSNFYFKNCELTKKNFVNSEFYFIEDTKNNLIKTNSHLKYLSNILNENDSLFIKKQIDSNIKTTINELKKHNFKIYDKNIINDSIACRIKISLPIFNKSFDKFYIIIEEGSSFGEYLFKKNKNKNWLFEKRISLTTE